MRADTTAYRTRSIVSGFNADHSPMQPMLMCRQDHSDSDRQNTGSNACPDCVPVPAEPLRAHAMPEDRLTAEPRSSRHPSRLFLPSVFLFVIWLVFNSSIEFAITAIGILVSVVLALIFVSRGDVWKITITPGKLLHFVAFTGIFLVELVKANVNMLRFVYAPRIVIRPGIVKIRMPLKSPLGRLALANSIALTPGSLVMDLRGDSLFVHWLDVKATDPEEATRMIIGPFEKHLGAAFG